jgi:hypothetical protein
VNSKIPPSPYNIPHHESSITTNGNESVQSSSQQANGAAKHSMLDKLKLFNKDKERSKSSKRTSSSSGFSSARSDSSLSLNNDPNASATASSKSKKNDTLNGNKSKTSKLLATKVAKDSPVGLPAPALKSQVKGDKKIARNATNETNGEMKLQKVPTVKFQPQSHQMTQLHSQHQLLLNQQNDLKLRQQQQQQQFRKVEIRTDARTGLPQPQHHHQPKAIIQPVTSIPKPMAAIKGTTKQNEIKRDEIVDVIKMDKTIHNSSISLNCEQQKTQIVNPLGMSPLHNQLLNQNGIHASSQSMSDSVHSTSTNNHSNSSESSVIYRPSASDSGSEFYHSNMPVQNGTHRNPIPNRKVDHFNDALLTNGHKFNTIPSKLNGIGSNQMATTIFEEGKQQQASVPLRSIMRTYNNNNGNNSHHVTLPTRGTRGGQNLVNGYYEEHNHGSSGYCSESDALRKAPIRYSDSIENGYLSEGSGAVTGSHFMSIFRNRPQMPSTIAEER